MLRYILFLLVSLITFLLTGYFWLIDLGMIALHVISQPLGSLLVVWGGLSLVISGRYIVRYSLLIWRFKQ